MDVSLVLLTSFVALLGLQMCVAENPNGRFEAQMNAVLDAKSITPSVLWIVKHCRGNLCSWNGWLSDYFRALVVSYSLPRCIACGKIACIHLQVSRHFPLEEV